MERKVKHPKSKGYGTSNIMEVTYIVTREEAKKLFSDFLIEPAEDSKRSIRALLEEGFRGINNMSNTQLARELEEWHLIRDPETENLKIVISE